MKKKDNVQIVTICCEDKTSADTKNAEYTIHTILYVHTQYNIIYIYDNTQCKKHV